MAPAWSSGQETRVPEQPGIAPHDRTRRSPRHLTANNEQNPPSTQTQQLANRQFPLEQRAPVVRRPEMNLPHASAPVTQRTPQPAQPPVQAPKPQHQQQAPSGLALQPANPPRITYAAGQLTVTASNS